MVADDIDGEAVMMEDNLDGEAETSSEFSDNDFENSDEHTFEIIEQNVMDHGNHSNQGVGNIHKKKTRDDDRFEFEL
jgi:hypothetical protein